MANAIISAAGSGTTLVVGGVPGQTIRVHSWTFGPAADGTFTWESDSNPLSGGFHLLAGKPDDADYHPGGHFYTNPGEPLNLSGDQAAGGHLDFSISGNVTAGLPLMTWPDGTPIYWPDGFAAEWPL